METGGDGNITRSHSKFPRTFRTPYIIDRLEERSSTRRGLTAVSVCTWLFSLALKYTRYGTAACIENGKRERGPMVVSRKGIKSFFGGRYKSLIYPSRPFSSADRPLGAIALGIQFHASDGKPRFGISKLCRILTEQRLKWPQDKETLSVGLGLSQWHGLAGTGI